jgi:cytochrome oxidase complex assembly protein 1
VPLGCFSVALLFLAFVGSILMVVFTAMKSTDVYKDALARAKTDPAVIEALGSPINDGFLLSGNTNVNGASGESNLAIPISGPKGKGTIYVSANKSLGRWTYSGLVVELGQAHERIDLLQKATPSN